MRREKEGFVRVRADDEEIACAMPCPRRNASALGTRLHAFEQFTSFFAFFLGTNDFLYKYSANSIMRLTGCCSDGEVISGR